MKKHISLVIVSDFVGRDLRGPGLGAGYGHG